MKKALILNTSLSEINAILALKKLGYYVIATGNVEGQPGEKYCDEYIKGDYSNMDFVLKLSQDKNIDAICACCNDFGVISATYVAEQLNLPGYDTMENTLILHHKDKFKEFAKRNGIISPISNYFSDISEALSWAVSAQYPLIIKPIDLTGGKGVSKATNHEELIAGIKNAFGISRAKHIVVEPFIEGTQHAICTFLRNQKVVAMGSNNEYSIVNPYRVEIDTFPADGIDKHSVVLIKEIEKIAGLLHLVDGIFHVQYIVKDGTPYIIEGMRRLLGNMYGVPCNLSTGFDWDLWQMSVYCGEPLDKLPNSVQQKGYFAYRNIMATQDGVIEDVCIPKDIEKYVIKKCLTWKRGDIVENYLNTSLGLFFFKFDSKEEMNNVLFDRYKDIHVQMKR